MAIINKKIIGFTFHNEPDNASYIEIWFKDEHTGEQEVCTIYELYVNPVKDILNQ